MTNLTVGAAFLLLGAYLAWSARSLPPGLGGLPGPGFFPLVIGLVMAGLAAVLILQALRQPPPGGFRLGNPRTLAGVLFLTTVYLLLWGVGGFPLRTAVYLALLLRFLGERWQRSALISAIMTTALTLAFQYGLRLTLE